MSKNTEKIIFEIENRKPTTTYNKKFQTNGGKWTEEERNIIKYLNKNIRTRNEKLTHFARRIFNLNIFSHRSFESIRSQINDIESNPKKCKKYIKNKWKNKEEIHIDSLFRYLVFLCKKNDNFRKHLFNQWDINFKKTGYKK